MHESLAIAGAIIMAITWFSPLIVQHLFNISATACGYMWAIGFSMTYLIWTLSFIHNPYADPNSVIIASVLGAVTVAVVYCLAKRNSTDTKQIIKAWMIQVSIFSLWLLFDGQYFLLGKNGEGLLFPFFSLIVSFFFVMLKAESTNKQTSETVIAVT